MMLQCKKTCRQIIVFLAIAFFRVPPLQRVAVAVRPAKNKIFIGCMATRGSCSAMREEVLANYRFFSHCSIAAFFRVPRHTTLRGRRGDHTQKAKKNVDIIIIA